MSVANLEHQQTKRASQDLVAWIPSTRCRMGKPTANFRIVIKQLQNGGANIQKMALKLLSSGFASLGGFLCSTWW